MTSRLTLKDPRIPYLVAVLLAGIGMLPTLRFVWHHFDHVRGWEADDVARAIVGGHGFSFAGNERWLWDKWNGDPNSFFPTAWVDPVFTYILAGAHWLFGAHAYLSTYALVLICIAIILFCAYCIGKRFGSSWTGTLTVALISFNTALGRAFFESITNSALAACLVLLTAVVAIRYFEQPTLRRLTALGLITGFTILSCPAVQYFPLLLAAALVVYHFKDRRQAVWRPLLMLLLAALVLSPWAIRNYVTFGDLVLVRNGAGQLAWLGTVGPAETFMPGAAMSPLPAPWHSDGPRDAVRKMLDKDARLPMNAYLVKSVMAAPPAGYHELNEAARDAMYLDRTKNFIRQHPSVAAQMALTKLEVYVMRFGVFGLLVVALAVLGSLLAIRDLRTWPLSLLAVSFSGPFILIIAYYGRYRAPIEPVFAVLAAIGVSVIVSRIASRKSLSFQNRYLTPTENSRP